jgi:hypothetical protein
MVGPGASYPFVGFWPCVGKATVVLHAAANRTIDLYSIASFADQLQSLSSEEQSGRSGISTNSVALCHIRTDRPPQGRCSGGHPSP